MIEQGLVLRSGCTEYGEIHLFDIRGGKTRMWQDGMGRRLVACGAIFSHILCVGSAPVLQNCSSQEVAQYVIPGRETRPPRKWSPRHHTGLISGDRETGAASPSTPHSITWHHPPWGSARLASETRATALIHRIPTSPGHSPQMSKSLGIADDINSDFLHDQEQGEQCQKGCAGRT